MADRTLANLNEIAKPFLRGGEFVLVSSGRLKVYLPDTRRPARRNPFMMAQVRQDRTYFLHRRIPNVLGLGGTDERTLCQLILWWRNQPRLPGRVLKNWQERNAQFCAALDAIGYDDAASLNCVLCGRPHEGLDWWSLDGVTGPCCSFGKCRKGEVVRA